MSMTTKLIYVLTSTADMNFIDQAHIAIYTARYHNLKAHITLLIDDITDTVLVGKRAEILNYISEKIVVDFPLEMGMKERSRQIKTNIPKWVNGDFLFIDSDTIVTQSLAEIDNCLYDMGAVWESHLAIADFHPDLFDSMQESALKLGWDGRNEQVYFSSGVVYVKDNSQTRQFFSLWNQYYNEGLSKGVSMDQPSFAKANIESNYLIKQIDDRWNCILFTHPLFDKEAKVLHFSWYRNRSYIFDSHFLEKVKKEGIEKGSFIEESILNPLNTYLPNDNALYHYKLRDFFQLKTIVKNQAKKIYYHLNKEYGVYLANNRVEQLVKRLFQKKLFNFGATLLILYKYYRVKISKKYRYVENASASHHF